LINITFELRRDFCGFVDIDGTCSLNVLFIILALYVYIPEGGATTEESK
jgi:hypothetical protein